METRTCLENLRAVLEDGDSSLDAVVKTTVYITDMGDFEKMNSIYGEYFGKSAESSQRCEE